MHLIRRGSKDRADGDSGARVQQALATLQQLLPSLNDADKVKISARYEYATEEFLSALGHAMVSRDGEQKSRAEMSEQEYIKARCALTADAPKLMMVLVGLPARGKSMIGNNIANFLVWRGWKTKMFSVGQARREEPRMGGTPASFFDSSKQ